MQGSVKVEINELSRLAGLLDQTHTELLGNEGSRASGGQVGNDGVAGSLHDFYGNWDYRRKELAERLEVLSTLLMQAADVYSENERALVDATHLGGDPPGQSTQAVGTDHRSFVAQRTPPPFESLHGEVHPRTSPVPRPVSFGQEIARVRDMPDGQFEILKVGTHPERYIVNLAGVEFNGDKGNAWDRPDLRDGSGATDAFLLRQDAYARRVELEMQRAGVPSGAEVMIVGHSYGAIAAMNIAADKRFNQPGNSSSAGGYHVQVTDVFAAGAGVKSWIGEPPKGTNVMVAINRTDEVPAVMTATQGSTNPFRSVDDAAGAVGAGTDYVESKVFHNSVVNPVEREVSPGRVTYEFESTDKLHGHDCNNYITGLNGTSGAAEKWMNRAAAKYFAGGGQAQQVLVDVPDRMRT